MNNTANPQGKGKNKILIVDDDRANIMVLNHILKPIYSTHVALDGKTAIDIARQYAPDLILLDIVMPGMDGFEVLTELKREDSLSRIPVIIITALDTMEDEEAGFFLGAADYITKPFRGPIVRARVKTHLRMVEYVREIERFGIRDMLTGLPNRRALDERAIVEWNRAAREKQPLSVLMIDADNFKNYNYKYGHTQGDALLQTIAGIFEKAVKRAGDFAARWGGEEFTVLLPNTDRKGAAFVAEQIRANIESASISHPDGTVSNVTVSIGVNTEIPTPDKMLNDFIVKADNMLYEAKALGKNRVCG